MTDEPTTVRIRVNNVEPQGSVALCTGHHVAPPYSRVTFYADHRMALPIAEHIRHAQEDGDLPVADVPEWSIA